jgi:hypothetical protein
MEGWLLEREEHRALMQSAYAPLVAMGGWLLEREEHRTLMQSAYEPFFPFVLSLHRTRNVPGSF